MDHQSVTMWADGIYYNKQRWVWYNIINIKNVQNVRMELRDQLAATKLHADANINFVTFVEMIGTQHTPQVRMQLIIVLIIGLLSRHIERGSKKERRISLNFVLISKPKDNSCQLLIKCINKSKFLASHLLHCMIYLGLSFSFMRVSLKFWPSIV